MRKEIYDSENNKEYEGPTTQDMDGICLLSGLWALAAWAIEVFEEGWSTLLAEEASVAGGALVVFEA